MQKEEYRIHSFLLNHWRGKNNLLWTVLIALIGLRLVFGWAQSVVPTGWLVVWSLVGVLLLVWQLTGAWRATDLHVKFDGGSVLMWAAYICMLVTTVATLLQLADAFSDIAPDPVVPVRPPLVLQIENNGKRVVISGTINWEQNSALKRAVASMPELTEVRLDSDGGLVYAARGLGLVIQQAGFNTNVTTSCLSACTLAFIAGRERRASGELGFHRYAADHRMRVQTFSTSDEALKDQRYFTAQGVSQEFIERMYQAAPDDIWVPDIEVLRAAGVVTH